MRSLSPAFEFCEICKRNHDQGRRHKYFPAHARALAALLVRFKTKLSDLRHSLQNPSRPHTASTNRLWCVFCHADVDVAAGDFAWSGAIYHMASEGHFGNLREFFGKHGGGKERIDSFMVSESELAKWEKGCEALKHASSLATEGPIGSMQGPSIDIHHEHTSRNMDNLEKDSISISSHAVMPLQNLTYEDYSISCSDTTKAGICGSAQYGFTSQKSVRAKLGNGSGRVTDMQLTCQSSSRPSSVGLSPSNGKDPRSNSRSDCHNALQNVTTISLPSEETRANIHTGAQPPWLDTSENHWDSSVDTGLLRKGTAYAPSEHGKSRKLNPKRVGAAWAEKRRLELEMEKRGEVVSKVPDVNWLPNFGRVWQTGTRKESRKEFGMEKHKIVDVEIQPELPVDVQPYISKRMLLVVLRQNQFYAFWKYPSAVEVLSFSLCLAILSQIMEIWS